MKYKIMVAMSQTKKIKTFEKDDKIHLTKALNSLESSGHTEGYLVSPIHNIWRMVYGKIRIIYKIKGKKIIIIGILKGFKKE
jgi:mRNA-degrading endonuclease RelE of RelBE toxin-antitoxin system